MHQASDLFRLLNLLDNSTNKFEADLKCNLETLTRVLGLILITKSSHTVCHNSVLGCYWHFGSSAPHSHPVIFNQKPVTAEAFRLKEKKLAS